MSESVFARTPSSSRLGNITGALLLGEYQSDTELSEDDLAGDWDDDSIRAAELLDGLFSTTLLIGGEPPPRAPGKHITDRSGPSCALRGIVTAFEAASTERVLILSSEFSMVEADLLLALTAWPENDVVVPVDELGEYPCCAIYRREACLDRGRARLESKDFALGGLLDDLETTRVSMSELGFGVEADGFLTRRRASRELLSLEGR